MDNYQLFWLTYWGAVEVFFVTLYFIINKK